MSILKVASLQEGTTLSLSLFKKVSEAEVHWREFLASLRARGLIVLAIFVDDENFLESCPIRSTRTVKTINVGSIDILRKSR